MTFNTHTAVALNAPKHPTANNQVKLSSANGVALYADTSPAPTADADDRAGWLWTKVASDTSKFNYYFYGEGSTAMKVKDITSLNAVLSIDTHPSGVSVPFFIVYTKPTGSGDFAAWHHSKFVYTINNPHAIDLGEKISAWSVNETNVNKNYRSVEFNTILTSGDADVNEEILYISIQSDSVAQINTKILIENVGYSFNNGVVKSVDLV